ncbi:hypothetical protein N8H74_26365 [Pseudomonas sp. B2M1-30]|uniref:hypothetical protein n=1 Tax=Pseudomonas TaxID=286 RepID=UPI0021CA043A|nr:MULTISPECIES: hypothetical protein [Pseudomonas]MCU0121800.1 hypothetical protein [Pseudomonas sp. B2M1-30]MCU7264508.1 hypothetical protein [Pseudomonas koreensis]
MTRMRHDCVGKNGPDHCTANAVVIKQAKRIVYGINTDYSDNHVFIKHCNDGEYLTPKEFGAEKDREGRAGLGIRNGLDQY